MGRDSATTRSLTIGLDLGDQYSHCCVVNAAGEIEDREVHLCRPRQGVMERGLRAHRVAAAHGEGGIDEP